MTESAVPVSTPISTPISMPTLDRLLDGLAVSIGERGYRDTTAQAAIDKATEGRAAVLALGYALAAAEAATGNHSWRTVNKSTARYLSFLAAQGYTLSPVEERAAGVKKKRTRTAKPQADDGQGDAE